MNPKQTLTVAWQLRLKLRSQFDISMNAEQGKSFWQQYRLAWGYALIALAVLSALWGAAQCIPFVNPEYGCHMSGLAFLGSLLFGFIPVTVYIAPLYVACQNSDAFPRWALYAVSALPCLLLVFFDFRVGEAAFCAVIVLLIVLVIDVLARKLTHLPG